MSKTKSETTPTTAEPTKEVMVPHKVFLPADLDNRLRNMADAERGPPLRMGLQTAFREAVDAFVTSLERSRNKGRPYPQRPI